MKELLTAGWPTEVRGRVRREGSGQFLPASQTGTKDIGHDPGEVIAVGPGGGEVGDRAARTWLRAGQPINASRDLRRDGNAWGKCR